jgi:microcin C transport system substrate-binding protein
MNLEVPLFQNKDFRKAIQYAFNFDEINEKLMYGAYYQMVSTFTGSFYQNHDLKVYGFNPSKVREHMAAAGYARGPGGIWVRGDGRRASWTLTYGNPGLTRHLTVMKQTFQKLGFDVQLQQIEAGASFQRLLERTYEMGIVSQTTELFPEPHQYFASVFAESKNNNNFWGFANSRADSLIDLFRFSMEDAERMQAMHDLDALIQDEAFYVPFWTGPFNRMLYWDDVQFPSFYLPKRFEQIAQWQVFWIDPGRKQALTTAMQEKRALDPDQTVDEDPYGVKSTIERSLGLIVAP